MENTAQILAAMTLGTIAFNEGKKATPCQNADLMNMIGGRKIGETPKGEASSVKIMEAYLRGWTNANLAAIQADKLRAIEIKNTIYNKGGML
jgi:hypothetical protein